MSLRVSSSIFCAGIAGFVCLALVGVSRGGEGARNIEVVPFHGAAMDTNFDDASAADKQDFKAWSPHAPNTLQTQPRPANAMLPPPRPQAPVDPERERELLDRRKNWVFMTPEEYASPDRKKDGLENEDGNKRPSTAMERFYQRMNDSERASFTNQVGKSGMDRWMGRTNFVGGDVPQPGRGAFAEVPFTSSPETGVFRPVRRPEFADVFGSDSRDTLRSPEAIQAEADQKAHMESFKQLWNIDQPPAPAPVVSPDSKPIDSGPLFGFSSPAMPSATPVSSFDGRSSTQPQTPVPAPVIVPRTSGPPRSNFIPPQRPF